jgi:hypothetical protein
VREYDDYFCLKMDVTGKLGFISYQAMMMLSYRVAGDLVDEYTSRKRLTQARRTDFGYSWCTLPRHY